MVITYFNNRKQDTVNRKQGYAKGVTYKQVGDKQILICEECANMLTPKQTYAEIKGKDYCLGCHRAVIEGWDTSLNPGEK